MRYRGRVLCIKDLKEWKLHKRSTGKNHSFCGVASCLHEECKPDGAEPVSPPAYYSKSTKIGTHAGVPLEEIVAETKAAIIEKANDLRLTSPSGLELSILSVTEVKARLIANCERVRERIRRATSHCYDPNAQPRTDWQRGLMTPT